MWRVKIKKLAKELFHRHKYKTLLMYPPHDMGSKYYGFLMRCDCGYSWTTNLPMTITEVFEVRSTK